MFDVYLRNLKDAITEPLSKLIARLVKHRISPNTLTCISGIFGLISVYFLFQNTPSSAFLFWVLNRIFDGLDGSYARLTNQQSDFGGYLDILVDFTIYGLIPLAVTAGSSNTDITNSNDVTTSKSASILSKNSC